MNCSSCGIQLNENLFFCGNCGNKVLRSDTKSNIYKKNIYIDKNDGFKIGLIKVLKLDFIALIIFIIDQFVLYEFLDLGGPISFIAIISILLVPFIFLIIYRGQRLGVFIAWLVTIFFVIPGFMAIGMIADNLRGPNNEFYEPSDLSEKYPEI